MADPTSKLTLERPDIWQRGLVLATGLTGYRYAPKVPLADGTIYACGGVYTPQLPLGGDPDRMCVCGHSASVHYTQTGSVYCAATVNDDGAKLPCDCGIRRKSSLGIRRKSSPSVAVPDGAMEWLLHEVGHWIAATPEERKLPNYGLSASTYGLDGEREWQAWAFEEIVLAPFGPARLFAPVTQRDGAAFEKAGPMPGFALDHIEKRLREHRVDVEAWRLVWGEWVRWGRAFGERAPWGNANG